jgi:hypothetical protein
VHFAVKTAFYKLKKIRTILLVGAPGFEPGASCAQASHGYFWKPFLSNTLPENKRLVRKFSSGWQYQNVALHAQSPPNFPHSEITTKVLLLVPTSATAGGGLENRCK